MNKDDENFFWPFDPSRRGQFYFQFPEPGIFRFKVENDQIGTILVTPRKRIHRISFPTDEFGKKNILKFFSRKKNVFFQFENSTQTILFYSNGTYPN